MSSGEKLAIDGGSAVRSEPMPGRGLIGQEEKAAAMALFEQAIESGNAFGYGGPSTAQYEKDFTDFMGGGYAVSVNSGTNAVYVSLGALGLDALSEVIVPPISDPGGVMPVPMLCLVPVPADSDPRSHNTSAEQIEKVITERTRAIVVAHISGDPVDMDPVMELAKKHNLYVIEDCAQAHGAMYKGKPVGSIGHFGAFSTMFGKHHCTGGQGGVVYTNNEDLYWQAKRFADRGKPFNIPNSRNVIAGINCNLNDLSAVIGSAQLKKLASMVDKRRNVAQMIKGGIADNPVVSYAWQTPDCEPSYWFVRFKVELDAIKVDIDGFMKALNAEGIPCDNYNHIPVEFPWFENKAVFGKSGFPWNCSDYKGQKNPKPDLTNAHNVIATHFRITIHEAMTQKETDDIVKAINKVTSAYTK